MPIIPDTIPEREAQCPYCWEGTIVYDTYSNRLYCKYCCYTVKCEGLENAKVNIRT